MAAPGRITVVSTKGQVILPKAIRDQLRWDAGTRLVVEPAADGVLLKPGTIAFPAARPDDVFACLFYKGEPKSLEQMAAALAMDWAEGGMDFADALHLAAAAGCECFLTFDKRLARSGARMGGVPVMAP